MTEEKIHEFEHKLKCFGTIAIYSVRKIVQYLSQESDIYKNCTHHNPKIAFSSVLLACEDSLKHVKSINWGHNKREIYESKVVIKQEINLDALDSSFLIEILKNLPAYPLGKKQVYAPMDATKIIHDNASCTNTEVCCAICLLCSKCKKCEFIKLCSHLNTVHGIRNYHGHGTYDHYKKIEEELLSNPRGDLAKDWNTKLKSLTGALKWLLNFVEKKFIDQTTKDICVAKLFDVEMVEKKKARNYLSDFEDQPDFKLFVKCTSITTRELTVRYNCESKSTYLQQIGDLNSQSSRIFRSTVELLAKKKLETQLGLENITEKCGIVLKAMNFLEGKVKQDFLPICATFHINGIVPDSFMQMTSPDTEKLMGELTNIFETELYKTLQVDKKEVKVTCVGWNPSSIHVYFEILLGNSASHFLKSSIKGELLKIIKAPQVGSILESHKLNDCEVDISLQESCMYGEMLSVGFTISIYNDDLVDKVDNILPRIETELHSEISKKILESSHSPLEKFKKYITEEVSQDAVEDAVEIMNLSKDILSPLSTIGDYVEQPTIKKNFLKILNEDIYIYGIDVDVDVDVDIVAAKLTLQHPVEFPKKPVCYGDNLYAKHPISSSKIVFPMTNEDGRQYKVGIYLLGRVKELDLLKACLMIKDPGIKGVLNQARKLCYNPIVKPVNINKIWSQFPSTTTIKHWEMDFLSTEAFRKSISVIEYLHELTGFDATKSPRKLTEKERKRLLRHIKDFEVELAYGGRTKLYVNDVMVTSAKEQTLEIKQGGGRKKYTIEEFFQEKKDTTLKYPDLPCLHVGSPNGTTYVPMELCKLMPTKKRVTVPYKCWEKTDDNFKNHVNEMLQNRQQPVTIRSWGLVFSNIKEPIPDEDVKTFQTKLIEVSASVGLNIGPPLFCEKFGEKYTAEQVIWEAFERDRKIELLLVVMAGTSPFYGKLKSICESELRYTKIVDKDIKTVFQERGLVTQGITFKNLQKHNKELIKSVSVQLREKIGAAITESTTENPEKPLGMFKEPIIFIGASITFPTEEYGKSVTSVVGSVDHLRMRYKANVYLQTGEKAIILDLFKATKECLLSFWRHLGVKPSKIIFYRLRVHDWHISKVLNAELYAIQKACTELDSDYQPGITFISVKRKPFFVEEEKILNIPAYCHAGFKESRPFIYHILWDDSGFAIEDLKKLSIFLCHVHVQFKRFLSVPAPGYYAHLISERMKWFLMTTSRKDILPKDTQDTSYDIKDYINIHPALADKFS